MIADVMNSAYKLAWRILPKRWADRLFDPQPLSAHSAASPLPPFLVMELLQFAASMEINPAGRLNALKKKDLRTEVDELMANLKMLILKASIQRYSKAELVGALKTILQSYTCLMGTLYEAAVLLFIARMVRRNFDLEIPDDELRRLWN